MSCYATKVHYVEAFRLGIDETPNWFNIEGPESVLTLDNQSNLMRTLPSPTEDNPENTVSEIVGVKGDFVIKSGESTFSILKPAEFLEIYELKEF